MNTPVGDLLAANPFPGLRPFRPDEADRYFGRRQQIDELLALLALRRLIAVAGASGSGKSSLVLAGLLDALAQRHAAGDDETQWRPAVMRPGTRPIAHLAAALSEALDGTIPDPDERERRVATLYGQLRLGGLGLVEAVRRAHLADDARVLVVVDQFEEIFRFTRVGDAGADPDEASAFVKLLLQAATDIDAPLRIVLTLRSDTLGSCAEFRDLPEAVSRGQYLVPRLEREQRKEAITRPVQLRGARIAPRLVQRLLNDVSEDFDDLPIMQHALARTWARWAVACEGDRPIDLDDYDAVGGAAMALSNHADEAADEVTRALGGQPRAVEKVFRALTERLPAGAEVRRPLAFATLCAVCGGDVAAVTAVVERFRRADTAFLMPASDVPLATNPVIDISHESLIRQWRRLRGWVQAETAARAELLRLIGEAERRDQSDGNLWRGRNLERALEWEVATQPNAAWVGLYTAGDGDAQWKSGSKFLVDSQAAVRAERRRERTRIWSLRALGALVLVVSVGAALNNMVRQREARADEFTSRALLELAHDPARSAHMAALALAHDESDPRAEFALRQAMATLEVAHAERILTFGGPVADAHFSADHSTLVVAAGNSVSVIDARSWQPLAPPLVLDSPVRQAWLVGGRKWIASLTRDGKARAQPLAGGKPVALGCDAKDQSAMLMAVSATDARQSESIAVGCVSGEVVTARASAEGIGARVSLGAGSGALDAYVTALGFNGSGEYLASGDARGRVQVWKTGQPGAWLMPAKGEDAPLRHNAAIRDVGFDPRDDRLLSTASDDGTTVVWTLDLPNRRLALPGQYDRIKYTLQHHRPVTLARFAQRADDDSRLLTVADKRVFFWDDETHYDVRQHDDRVVAAAVSDDGELIVSASVDGTARVWSTRSGSPIAVLLGHRGELTSASFGPAGTVLTAGTDNTVRVWRLRPPTLLAARDVWIKSAVFDRAGTIVALCGESTASTRVAAKSADVAGSLCRIVDATDLTLRRDKDKAALPAREAMGMTTATSASLSADGQWLAVTDLDRSGTLLWSPQRRALQPPPCEACRQAVFARDAAVLLTLDGDGTVALWDANTLDGRPKALQRFAPRRERNTVAISPDGRWVAAAEGKQVTLLDRDAPAAAPLLLGEHRGDVRALAFSRDGRRLASASTDRGARVWTIGAKAAPVELTGGHSAALTSVAFSADGRLVVTASADNSVRVWDAVSGRELAPLHRHGDAVNAVAFAPNDDRILSASDDGTAKLAACDACTTPLPALRQQVSERIALDPIDQAWFDAQPRPWFPWLRLPRR